MRVVAFSDIHGDFEPIYKILDQEKPDLLLCAGDWGIENEVSPQKFDKIVSTTLTFTVFGNHDNLELLPKIKNIDGSDILLQNGVSYRFGDIAFGGINGIWAKSYKKPFYITDEDVRKAAANLAFSDIDILVTHGCPIGMADLTPIGTHGGQRCFADAFKTVQPQLHLCGHMHRKSSYSTKDGRLILNLGFAKEGDYSVITFQNGTFELESKRI